MIDFDHIWKSGPWRKLGKPEAEKRFKAHVKTGKDMDQLQAAIDAYSQFCRENSWYTPMHGSVFFGSQKGWKNWVPDSPEPKSPTIFDETSGHLCIYCTTSHRHTCRDCESGCCFGPKEMVCEVFLSNLKGRRNSV